MSFFKVANQFFLKIYRRRITTSTAESRYSKANNLLFIQSWKRKAYGYEMFRQRHEFLFFLRKFKVGEAPLYSRARSNFLNKSRPSKRERKKNTPSGSRMREGCSTERNSVFNCNALQLCPQRLVYTRPTDRFDETACRFHGICRHNWVFKGRKRDSFGGKIVDGQRLNDPSQNRHARRRRRRRYSRGRTYVCLDQITSALIELQPTVFHDIFHLSSGKSWNNKSIPIQFSCDSLKRKMNEQLTWIWTMLRVMIPPISPRMQITEAPRNWMEKAKGEYQQ